MSVECLLRLYKVKTDSDPGTLEPRHFGTQADMALTAFPSFLLPIF